MASQLAAIESVRPGVRYRDVHLTACRVLCQGLVDEGLLSGSVDGLVERGAHALFFPHGVGHLLGLDVHDVGFFHEPMQAGMVFTVEPGIYIPEEGLGIRIENNILITTKGQQDLMKNIPIEPEEIEELMGARK